MAGEVACVRVRVRVRVRIRVRVRVRVSRWRTSSSQKERISCRMPLMRKYLAEEARGAQPAVRLGQDVWRQGAPSAAQQQHKPVLRERCRVDVRDERGADARKAHNELEVAQRGVLLIVEAHVGLVEYHLRSLRTAVWAAITRGPPFGRATLTWMTASSMIRLIVAESPRLVFLGTSR